MSGKKVIREELDGQIKPPPNKFATGKEIWDSLPRSPGGEATLSQELLSAIELLLTEGNTRENAARVVGVQSRTLNKWLKQGIRHIEMEEPSIYADLVWVCERCQGGLERALVQAAMRAISNPFSDGTLSLKILERRNVQEWAPALPAQEQGGTQYVGMSTIALRTEVRRVLEEAAKNEIVPEADVVPQLEEG